MNESAAKNPETSPPLLAFDGDCRLCVGSIRGLERTGILGNLETCAATLVKGEDRQVLDQHRRAGEIVLLLDNRKSALSGAAAFRWILQQRFPGFLSSTLNWLPIFWVMTLGYRLIASWRRILIPPPVTPDPLFPEPGWVGAFRGSVSILLLCGTVITISIFSTKLGIGNSDQWSPADQLLQYPGFLIGAVLILNTLLVTLLGYRRIIDLFATQTFTCFLGALASGTLLAIPAFVFKIQVPLIVVCLLYVVITSALMQNYWIWLGIGDEKKGLTAQFTTTLAVTLGGSTLWTGYLATFP